MIPMVDNEGELTGYYTLSSTSLGVRYLQHKKKGVGRYIIQRIAMLALDLSRNQGIRLLIVQAKEDAFDFYTKCGFDFVMESEGSPRLKPGASLAVFLV